MDYVLLILSTLVFLNVAQFIFCGYMVQRLVDKLMSRTYYDYQVAESLKKDQPHIRIPEGVAEDFGTINEVTVPF